VIYLDHNAITPLRPEAREALVLALDRFGNPSSVHRAGRDARDVLDLARDRVADGLGARPQDVVFTSGATEGAALAIRGVLGAAPAGRRRLVVTAVEHPCVLGLARLLAAEGTPLTVVPVDRRGEVDPAAFRAALGPDVALACAMRANNETGVLLAAPALAAAAREAGVPFLCDAVQAVGKIEVDVRTLGADLVLATGQKLGGPRGAGLLWVAPGVPLAPLFGDGRWLDGAGAWGGVAGGIAPWTWSDGDLRAALDHLAVREAQAGSLLAGWVAGGPDVAEASDHRPVVLDLRWW
jgi:cysteine desulfurase